MATLLCTSASVGHLDCVRILLEHDANISIKDEYDKTPMEMAELSSKSSIVKLLIYEGQCLQLLACHVNRQACLEVRIVRLSVR